MKKLLLACLTSLICVCYANAQNNDIPLSIGKGTPDGGDDSNPLYGALNSYGHLETISSASYPTLTINSVMACSDDGYIHNDVRIVTGGKLTITGDIMKDDNSSITVEEGGELIINGGTITQGNVAVKSGGKLSITGGGEIRLSDSNNFKVEKGGILNQSFGKVCISD